MAKRPNLVLIDVQNVLHAVGELRCVMQQQSHPMAIQLLADYVADFPEVWLFEDGGERSPRKAGGGCWRVGSGSDCADNHIVAWLQRHPTRRPALTVSADRDLGLRARGLGARVISPESFWRKFIVNTKTAGHDDDAVPADKPLRSDEVAMWMQIFGENDDLIDGEGGAR